MAGLPHQPRPHSSTTLLIAVIDNKPSIQWLSDYSSFLPLHAKWNRLVGDRSVFLRHEWFDAAWQWRRCSPDTHPAIICVWQGDVLIGVCPLLTRIEQHATVGRRVIEFLAVPDNQVCDIIVAPGQSSFALRAIASELAARSTTWDVMRLAYLPEGSVAASSEFARALKSHGLSSRVSRVGSNPYVSLNGNWEKYWATRSRALKKTMNLAANRLNKVGNVRVEWLNCGAESCLPPHAAIDAAIEISAGSWKRMTGNSLDNPGPQAFIRRLAELALREGWFSLWLLMVDETPIAAEWQLIFGDRVHALRSDYLEKHEALSPGTHLNGQLLKNLFDRGLQRYLMGPGDNPYKNRWAEQSEPLFHMDTYSASIRGRLTAIWEVRIRPKLRAWKAKINRKQEGVNR